MTANTKTTKRDETAKLATAFASKMSVKEIASFFQVSELEATNLIVRGKYLAGLSKAAAALQGDVA